MQVLTATILFHYAEVWTKEYPCDRQSLKEIKADFVSFIHQRLDSELKRIVDSYESASPALNALTEERAAILKERKRNKAKVLEQINNLDMMYDFQFWSDSNFVFKVEQHVTQSTT